MTAPSRLRICLAIVIFSVFYGALVLANPAVASAVASGYIVIVLTALFFVCAWRKT